MSNLPPTLTASVEALIPRLAQAAYIGLDTEFLRERTYRPQLCLLQLATETEIFCVDPLSGHSMQALRAVLVDGQIEKILHAARQDLEVLWPEFGALNRVFDTQVAASLTGLPAQIGYSDLVQRLLGVALTKAETRTDWSRRPLSDAQLHYAADDVRYLAPLREKLLEQLTALGRLDWLQEELATLPDPRGFLVDPEQAVDRLRWVSELDIERQRLAQRLAAWRERRAQEKDRPRTWILDDAGLRAMVFSAPRTREEMAGLQELQPGFVERSGAMVLEQINALGLPTRLPALPPRTRPSPEIQARIKRLSTAVQNKAQDLKMAAEILASRRDLEGLVAQPDASALLQGWRRAVIGETLLELL